MDNTLYDYSPITERPLLSWPNGARLAVYVGLNVEHFEIGKPSTSLNALTASLTPDPLNHGWRDYGARVGIWRLAELFDRFRIRPSILLNADVTERYPQIIEAGRKRGWAWLAHGRNNSNLHTDMEIEVEREVLKDIVTRIERATGQRPKGWLGPGLTETYNTPRLLKELGFDYILDWTADDQPFATNVPGVISVPYTLELNDINQFLFHSYTGEEFVTAVIDAFEQLHAESAQSGRVMAFALHPFVIGQAHRIQYLAKALEHIAAREGVWLTTSDEIAAHYIAHRAEAHAAA